MGASEPRPNTLETARRLGRLIAEAGWVVLTGGRPAGVMDAACAGAKSVSGSLTLGILPTGPDGPVSEQVDVAVFTGANEIRNVINVLSSDVVIACGVASAGTASEVALALKLGRPTILLAAEPEAMAFFRTIAGQNTLLTAATPEGAIALIEQTLQIPRGRPA
jgi:uncharacterized protein (TIGR00725 family)